LGDSGAWGGCVFLGRNEQSPTSQLGDLRISLALLIALVGCDDHDYCNDHSANVA